MSTAQSSKRPTHEYQPTIIETLTLLERLAIQLSFLYKELKQSWLAFKRNPAAFTRQSIQDLLNHIKTLLTSPNLVPACAMSVATVVCVVTLVFLFEKIHRFNEHISDHQETHDELVYLDVAPGLNEGIGSGGQGRVGFNNGRGEGSGPTPKRSQGGGGGGNGNPIPPQIGKLPPPSDIPAPIPLRPPVNPSALPVAGIDLDPALWKDLKAPVYGDPRAMFTTKSKGPGEGEGIGTGDGSGIGEGDGRGVGPGEVGNIGGGPRSIGGGGNGGAGERSGVLHPREVEQRARLISKPEPKYTEEARRNQITGTVMLRAVFSSSGEVVQIQALRSLPFGLTERAIAAAREIKFVPASKGGRTVSVFMQLEYNFNLY